MEVIISGKRGCIKKAAAIIAGLIKKKPDSVLGLATGSTMVPLYRELVRLYKKGKLDFSRVKTFNLDEYAGVKFNSKESYHYYMDSNLFNKVNIKKSNTYFPSSDGNEYEREIKRSGGLDLTILGIGINGHIAFNEPGSALNSKSRKIKLSNSTIKSNSRLFKSVKDMPREAYTMGIKTIMDSKKIVLLAFGSKKSGAISKSLMGRPGKSVPASVLRKHRDVTFILDRKAAAKI